MAGCHPEGVAETMEVRPGAVAVLAAAGDVVAVGVAAAHPLDEHGLIKTNYDVRWICCPKMLVNGR